MKNKMLVAVLCLAVSLSVQIKSTESKTIDSIINKCKTIVTSLPTSRNGRNIAPRQVSYFYTLMKRRSRDRDCWEALQTELSEVAPVNRSQR